MRLLRISRWIGEHTSDNAKLRRFNRNWLCPMHEIAVCGNIAHLMSASNPVRFVLSFGCFQLFVEPNFIDAVRILCILIILQIKILIAFQAAKRRKLLSTNLVKTKLCRMNWLDSLTFEQMTDIMWYDWQRIKITITISVYLKRSRKKDMHNALHMELFKINTKRN